MNSAVKIIKRGQNKTSTADVASQDEQTGEQSTREIVKTVKGWISELHQRRRDEQDRSSAFKISVLRQGQIVKLSIPTTQ